MFMCLLSFNESIAMFAAVGTFPTAGSVLGECGCVVGLNIDCFGMFGSSGRNWSMSDGGAYGLAYVGM